MKLRGKGVAVTEITNHSNSLNGGHKPDYDPATNDGDVFVRSLYFRDPNGTLLEFACWTTTFDESDIVHAPATAADAASPSTPETSLPRLHTCPRPRAWLAGASPSSR